jgi:hypothetical protein
VEVGSRGEEKLGRLSLRLGEAGDFFIAATVVVIIIVHFLIEACATGGLVKVMLRMAILAFVMNHGASNIQQPASSTELPSAKLTGGDGGLHGGARRIDGREVQDGDVAGLSVIVLP